MLDTIHKVMPILTEHFNNIIVYGFMIVSAIIVAIGLLKPILFNKIPNKQVRKVALAFSNVATCFISVLVIFLIKGWNFEYYILTASALSIGCIVTYWLYENTCLRNLIGTIGNIALKKLANIALVVFTKDDINELKTEVNKIGKELKADTRKAIKKATNNEDNDLKGL